MFAFIAATRTLFSSKPLRFRVTPKSGGSERAMHPLLAPVVALVLLYAGAAGLGVARLAGVLSSQHPTAMVVAFLWTLAVLAILCAVLAHGYGHINRRRAARIPLNVAGTWQAMRRRKVG